MASKKKVNKPQLHLCATAWSMAGYPSAEKEWSIDRKVKAAKKAGFDGFSGRAEPEMVEACRKYDIQLVGGVDVGSDDDAEEKLRIFKKGGAKYVNIQLCDHDTPIAKAATVARRVMEAAKKLRIKATIEWHRDTCTETPEKGIALAQQYLKRYKEPLPTNFDHSHPAIIKQLWPSRYWERIVEYEPELLMASELIHFRPFTGSHCQTPVTDGNGNLDGNFIEWRDCFLRPFFDFWLSGARAGKPLWAVVELGPKGSGYGLECFPDIWKDAIVGRAEIEKVWKNALRKWRK
ncbi:MAG: hypothetical protein JKY51_09720 [Opitutaceae bacterium]|nr:hypothetical protein [Opitutaceae bacterium]